MTDPSDIANGASQDRHSPDRQERLLLGTREAVALLSISERTLWGADIPKIRVGKNGVRYALVDLEAWIVRQRIAS